MTTLIVCLLLLCFSLAEESSGRSERTGMLFAKLP